jgi:hypothetical protein
MLKSLYRTLTNGVRSDMSHPAAKTSISDADKAKRRNQRVLDQARSAGLIGTIRDARLSGRVSGRLLAAAKERTHVASNTDLIELALSELALVCRRSDYDSLKDGVG